MKELDKKYYKQDLCEDAGRCKLYNPLLTQGQCEYYNRMCELYDELKLYRRALKRACESVGDGIVYKDIGTNKELNAEELEQMFIHQVEMENELKEWKKNRYNAS